MDQENLKASLQAEAAVNESAVRAWEEHFKPFFEDKEKDLFEAFRSVSATNVDDVMLIKLQSNVLIMIQDHFESKLNTAKMARQTLNELEDKEKTDD